MGKAGEGHAIVDCYVLRRFREASVREIFRACAYDTPNRSDPARDDAAVGQRADTDAEIDMLLLQADDAVAQAKPQQDVGIGFQKRRRDRHHMNATEHQ
jgi:hypothetical protein